MDAGKSARSCALTKEQRAAVKGWFLLTDKPVVYAANINEDGLAGDARAQQMVDQVRAIAQKEGAQVLVISAQVEEEIAKMEPSEKKAFLEEMGIGKSGLDRLVTLGYELLGLISFLTAGPKEVRAWTIEKGTKAPGAAGKIHSDFERGFIRAEVVAYDALVARGSMAACRDHGEVRLEGKDYPVADGDVVNVRFAT